MLDDTTWVRHKAGSVEAVSSLSISPACPHAERLSKAGLSRPQMSYGSHLYKACPERFCKRRDCREPPRSDSLRRRPCVSLCFKGQVLISPHSEYLHDCRPKGYRHTPPISEGCDPHSRWWEACSPAFDCGGSSVGGCPPTNVL